MQNPREQYPIKLAGIIVAILLLAAGTLGCFSKDGDNSDDKRKGFDLESLSGTVPMAYELSEPPIEPKPIINTSISKRVSNILAIWYFEKNAVYKDYGGTINIFLKNNGTNRIYVYRIGIKLSWQQRMFRQDQDPYAESGVYIAAGEKKQAGMVRFDGPVEAREYKYSLLFSLYLEDDSGSWNDCGEQETSDKSFSVVDFTAVTDYKERYNLAQYYDKINDLVDPLSDSVINLSHELASDYPGVFNIFQVCAIFDYVAANIMYFSDPSSTENYWCTPEQTIKFGGDCEDHSTLLASMMIALGGSARMYMTDSHAFTGLYIGDESNIYAITQAIHSYYRTDVSLFYLKDELGVWLMVDTIGSLYLGGLPLGAVPAKDGLSGDGWSWGFTETESFYITDVIPK
jgi:hypothetical protein